MFSAVSASSSRISIHALLAESDGLLRLHHAAVRISIHALLAESDFLFADHIELRAEFLSTLSLRRATPIISSATSCRWLFLSTLSLRRATRKINTRGSEKMISIHALLAESDRQAFFCTAPHTYFYPRSPCGERRHGVSIIVSDNHFYPRSPCGERLSIIELIERRLVFLSTLSLRRAT